MCSVCRFCRPAGPALQPFVAGATKGRRVGPDTSRTPRAQSSTLFTSSPSQDRLGIPGRRPPTRQTPRLPHSRSVICIVAIMGHLFLALGEATVMLRPLRSHASRSAGHFLFRLFRRVRPAPEPPHGKSAGKLLAAGDRGRRALADQQGAVALDAGNAKTAGGVSRFESMSHARTITRV